MEMKKISSENLVSKDGIEVPSLEHSNTALPKDQNDDDESYDDEEEADEILEEVGIENRIKFFGKMQQFLDWLKNQEESESSSSESSSDGDKKKSKKSGSSS